MKKSYEKILVIADGAAFGSEMEKLMRFIKNNPNVALYLPESFEWLILKSGLIEDRSVTMILENPQNYIDSGKYFSWERYFTSLLIQRTKDSYLKYSKSSLKPVYLQNNEMNKQLVQSV